MSVKKFLEKNNIVKRKFLLGVLLFLVQTPLFSENKVTVEVFFLSERDKSPISNLRFLLKETGRSYSTDPFGKAIIGVQSFGSYELRIVSSDRIISKEIIVTSDRQKIILTIKPETPSGIHIVAKKESESLSRYSLQQEEIIRLPGAQNDSLKALQTLPGISAVPPVGLTSSSFSNLTNLGNLAGSSPYSNSDRGFLVIRGGGTLQNGYYLDGFPMSYPYHLGDQSSVLNNNIIKSINVYSGAFPVQYGFATGGIIDIRTPDEVKKNHSIINVNTFLSDVYHQHKLSENAFAIVSARKSYPNYTLMQFYPDGIPQDAKYADYEDFQTKFNWKPGENHTITAMFFGAKDLQKYSKTMENEFDLGNALSRPPVGIDRSFGTSGLRYVFNNGSGIESSFSISNNSFKENYEMKYDNPLSGERIFGFGNVTRQNLTFAENNNKIRILENYLYFRFGAQYRETNIKLNGQDIETNNSQFLEIFNDLLDSNRQFRALFEGDRIHTKEIAQFAELEFRLGGFRFLPGYRNDYYDKSGEKKDSIRARIEYEFVKTGTKLLAGSGEHYNAPTRIEQYSSKSGNPNLKMEYSVHSSVGIEQSIGTDYLIKIEGFHNTYSNLVTPDSNIQNPYTPNNQIRDIVNDPTYVVENPYIITNLNYSNLRDGYSRGIEIFLKKNHNGIKRIFGWLSYTNSISKRNNHQARLTDDEQRQRTIDNSMRTLIYQTNYEGNYINFYDDGNYEILYDNDKEEYYDYDRTHMLSFVGGWKFLDDWQIGGKYMYLTNVPITPIVGSENASAGSSTGINLYLPTYSKDYNSARWPDFHQLDIRLDRFYNYQWGYMNVYIEFINFFGNRNQISQNFNNLYPYSTYSLQNPLTGNMAQPTNPEPIYNSNYINSKTGSGNVYYLPLISVGMQAKF